MVIDPQDSIISGTTNLPLYKEELILYLDFFDKNVIQAHVNSISNIKNILYNPKEETIVIVSLTAIHGWDGKTLKLVSSQLDDTFSDAILVGNFVVRTGDTVIVVNLKSGGRKEYCKHGNDLFGESNHLYPVKLNDRLVAFRDICRELDEEKDTFCIVDLENESIDRSVVQRFPIDDVLLASRPVYVPESNKLVGWKRKRVFASDHHILYSFSIDEKKGSDLYLLNTDFDIKGDPVVKVVSQVTTDRKFPDLIRGILVFRFQTMILALNVKDGTVYELHRFKKFFVSSYLKVQPIIHVNRFGSIYLGVDDGLCVLETHALEGTLTKSIKNRIQPNLDHDTRFYFN